MLDFVVLYELTHGLAYLVFKYQPVKIRSNISRSEIIDYTEVFSIVNCNDELFLTFLNFVLNAYRLGQFMILMESRFFVKPTRRVFATLLLIDRRRHQMSRIIWANLYFDAAPAYNVAKYFSMALNTRPHHCNQI